MIATVLLDQVTRPLEIAEHWRDPALKEPTGLLGLEVATATATEGGVAPLVVEIVFHNGPEAAARVWVTYGETESSTGGVGGPRPTV
jgi:hypothetical protein